MAVQKNDRAISSKDPKIGKKMKKNTKKQLFWHNTSLTIDKLIVFIHRYGEKKYFFCTRKYPIHFFSETKIFFLYAGNILYISSYIFSDELLEVVWHAGLHPEEEDIEEDPDGTALPLFFAGDARDGFLEDDYNTNVCEELDDKKEEVFFAEILLAEDAEEVLHGEPEKNTEKRLEQDTLVELNDFLDLTHI